MNFQVFWNHLFTQKTHIALLILFLFDLQLLSSVSQQHHLVNAMATSSASPWAKILEFNENKEEKEDYNEDSDAAADDSEFVTVKNKANVTLYISKAYKKWLDKERLKTTTSAPRIKENDYTNSTDWGIEIFCNVILVLFLVASIYLCKQVRDSRRSKRQLEELERTRLELGGLPLDAAQPPMPKPEKASHQLIEGFCLGGLFV